MMHPTQLFQQLIVIYFHFEINSLNIQGSLELASLADVVRISKDLNNNTSYGNDKISSVIIKKLSMRAYE